jgi:hypothetical protein
MDIESRLGDARVLAFVAQRHAGVWVVWVNAEVGRGSGLGYTFNEALQGALDALTPSATAPEVGK